MAQLPLISLIVPVYNVAPYLDACMESILAQTYENLEILLIDDGSRDTSGAMCDLWAEKDSRIRVIHQKNRGLSGARNTGLDVFAGEYVMFVDSDDVLSPLMCQTLYEMLDEGGDIAICDPVHIFPGSPWEFSLTDSARRMAPEEAIRVMWYQTAFLPSAWGKLYRRELFLTRRFTEGRLFEDIDLMHEVFYDAKVILYNPSRLYGYLHRENSITTKAFGVRDLDILIIARKILDFSQDKPELATAARAYAVTAALRVYLNAPRDGSVDAGLTEAREILKAYGAQVRKDPNIRKKNRYALALYAYCRPLMPLVYKLINRWK